MRRFSLNSGDRMKQNIPAGERTMEGFTQHGQEYQRKFPQTLQEALNGVRGGEAVAAAAKKYQDQRSKNARETFGVYVCLLH